MYVLACTCRAVRKLSYKCTPYRYTPLSYSLLLCRRLYFPFHRQQRELLYNFIFFNGNGNLCHAFSFNFLLIFVAYTIVLLVYILCIRDFVSEINVIDILVYLPTCVILMIII